MKTSTKLGVAAAALFFAAGAHGSLIGDDVRIVSMTDDSTTDTTVIVGGMVELMFFVPVNGMAIGAPSEGEGEGEGEQGLEVSIDIGESDIWINIRPVIVPVTPVKLVDTKTLSLSDTLDLSFFDLEWRDAFGEIVPGRIQDVSVVESVGFTSVMITDFDDHGLSLELGFMEYLSINDVLSAHIEIEPVHPVPEPATVLLFGLGLAGVMRRRRNGT